VSVSGRLCVVATPIGNMEDITLRALRVLREADVIAAEDTRHTRLLLDRHGISRPMISCHQFNEARRTGDLVAQIQSGQTVALVSDAGMPGVSDPGERLIRACVQAGVVIEILPGPSAVLHALVASGFAMTPFVFEGFLPVKSGQRAKAIARLADRQITTVFFESPHRIQKTLEELALQLPDRCVCVARELTKKFEEHLRGTAAELAVAGRSRQWKGEITLVIEAASRKKGAESREDDSEEG